MTVRKDPKTGTWTVITYVEGKQIWRRGFPTKREASKAELELKASPGNIKGRVKFDELAREFLIHQKNTCRMSTVKTNESRYTVHIKPYLGEMYIDKITPREVQKIVHRLSEAKEQYSPVYINHIISTISKIMNYAVLMDYIEKNPVKKIKKLKEDDAELQYMTLDEFTKLREALSADFYYQVFLDILFFTGIRVGECRALWWSQVDFAANTITIDAHVVDKGGTRREPGRKNNKNYTIYMTQNVRKALMKIYEIEKQKDGFELNRFIFGFYKPWSNNKIRLRFKKALQTAELRDMKIHSLRHGYASLLANHGATVQELSAALGDTLQVTLTTYAHMYADTNRQISNRVDRIIATVTDESDTEKNKDSTS